MLTMKNKEYSNEIDMRRIIREIKTRRWLFIILFLLIFGLAVAYVARSESNYTAHSTLLIEDNSGDAQGGRGGSMLQMMRIFSTGGFTSSSVDNEMLLISTVDVALRTVKRLNLNVNCIKKKGLTNHTLFEDAPISLTLDDECADTMKKAFNVRVEITDGKADIRVYTGRFFKTTLAEKKNATLPCHISTKHADFTISANTPDLKNGTFVFGVTSYSNAAWTLYKEVDNKILDKLADGVVFTYTSPNGNKAMAVLNTMMNEYNLKRLERKRETSLTELNFITERINSLYTDLRESEKEVEKFKSESNFVNIEAEAPILLESTLSAHEDLLKESAQILYYEQVLDILENGKDGMLPAFSTPGEGGGGKSGMIGDYNEQMALLLELRRSAKPGNKALSSAEERVNEMRSSIITSFSQLLKASKQAVSQRKSIVGSMDSHLNKLPAFEREYINLSRDQLLKNELYAFLVEKRENALMKLNSQDMLGYVIDKAYLEPKPSIKKTMMVLAAGFIFGIGFPLIIILMLMKRSDKICNAYDLRKFSLEDNTIELNLADTSVNSVRSAIMTRLAKATIYITASNSDLRENMPKRLVNSFKAAGIPVAEITPPDNDCILGSEIQNQVSDCMKDSDYVFVEVPELSRIKDIAPVANAGNALCILIIAADELTRGQFARYTYGIDTEKIIVVLVSKQMYYEK